MMNMKKCCDYHYAVLSQLECQVQGLLHGIPHDYNHRINERIDKCKSNTTDLKPIKLLKKN